MTDRTMVVLMAIAGVCLIWMGIGLGAWYCDYRHGAQEQEFTQVTHDLAGLGSRCVETLAAVVPGAVVVARQHGPVAIRPAVRDSLRVQRWTTP